MASHILKWLSRGSEVEVAQNHVHRPAMVSAVLNLNVLSQWWVWGMYKKCWLFFVLLYLEWNETWNIPCCMHLLSSSVNMNFTIKLVYVIQDDNGNGTYATG